MLVLGHTSPLYFLCVPVIVIYWFADNILSRHTIDYYFSVLSIILIGVAVDFLLTVFKLIEFTQGQLLPSWLMLLWVLFALTFSAGYRWLNKLPVIVSAILGGIFGPLAYWAASKLSSVEILSPVLFTSISAVFWGLLFLVLRLWHINGDSQGHKLDPNSYNS